MQVLTPVYSETIIFSIDELREPGSDGRPLLTVLQAAIRGALPPGPPLGGEVLFNRR